jgi:hypothetical protein
MKNKGSDQSRYLKGVLQFQVKNNDPHLHRNAIQDHQGSSDHSQVRRYLKPQNILLPFFKHDPPPLVELILQHPAS